MAQENKKSEIWEKVLQITSKFVRDDSFYKRYKIEPKKPRYTSKRIQNKIKKEN